MTSTGPEAPRPDGADEPVTERIERADAATTPQDATRDDATEQIDRVDAAQDGEAADDTAVIETGDATRRTDAAFMRLVSDLDALESEVSAS